MIMLLKRAGYLSALIALCICAILTGNHLFALLAAACAALVLISLALFLSAVRRIQLHIDLPETAAKNADFSARIRIDAGRFSGCMHMKLIGRAVNLLCGDIAPIAADAAGKSLEIRLRSPRCGKLSLQIDRLEITDPLGLFRKKTRLHAQASALILPEPFDIAIAMRAHDLPLPDSDEYSPDRPGNDPSELFGIRDYREGDALKRIHWKLSEKYDRTVVRELSLPVSHAVLLLLDNCPQTEIAPDDACSACEALISCSLSLADAGVYHRIAWINRETGIMEMRSIASTDDLYGEQGALLSARMARDDVGLIPRLLEQSPVEYSHLLIFAAARTQGVSALEGRATILMPNADSENAICCLRDKLTQLTV